MYSSKDTRIILSNVLLHVMFICFGIQVLSRWLEKRGFYLGGERQEEWATWAAPQWVCTWEQVHMCWGPRSVVSCSFSDTKCLNRQCTLTKHNHEHCNFFQREKLQIFSSYHQNVWALWFIFIVCAVFSGSEANFARRNSVFRVQTLSVLCVYCI
jgi:hypothetical protein